MFQRPLDHLARLASATHDVPRNASDLLEDILHHYANSLDIATIETELPGFQDALTYPTYTPRRGGIQLRCRYCNIATSEPAREVCRTCTNRHEPDEHRGDYGLPELYEETSE